MGSTAGVHYRRNRQLQGFAGSALIIPTHYNVHDFLRGGTSFTAAVNPMVDPGGMPTGLFIKSGECPIPIYVFHIPVFCGFEDWINIPAPRFKPSFVIANSPEVKNFMFS